MSLKTKSVVILATGRYLGEGFDLPCLDTLFLTFLFIEGAHHNTLVVIGSMPGKRLWSSTTTPDMLVMLLDAFQAVEGLFGSWLRN